MPQRVGERDGGSLLLSLLAGTVSRSRGQCDRRAAGSKVKTLLLQQLHGLRRLSLQLLDALPCYPDIPEHHSCHLLAACTHLPAHLPSCHPLLLLLLLLQWLWL